MRRPLFIILVFASMIGALALTLARKSTPLPDGLACPDRRVSTSGWTSRDAPPAELAAIIRWQELSAKQGKGYGQWYQARKRVLTCRQLPVSNQTQCRISARPCRYKRS